MATDDVSSALLDFNVDNTLGAAFLGVIGASILYGITFLQMYLYYHHYPRDSRLHKIAVGVLWACDTLHLTLTIHTVYYYVVSGFGNVPRLFHIVWSIKLQVAFNVIIILLVQSLYAFRVWILGGYHHGVLGYLVASVVAAGFVIGIVLAYEIYQQDLFVDVNNVAWAVNSSLAASTAIDFIIATAMCYYLRKSKGSESQLNSRISTVMQYSLSSGLLTSACSLSTLFTYTLMPDNLVYLGLQFMLTRLYVGSFLAMLNARQRRSKEDSGSTVGLPSLNHKYPHSPSSSFTKRLSSEPHSASSDHKPWNWTKDIEAQTHPHPAYMKGGRPDYMRQW